MTDVSLVMQKRKRDDANYADEQVTRHTRYDESLERLISPEGTFPAVGRSIVYRFGAFHALSQAALMQILPKGVDPAQVRCALTAVMQQPLKSPANFDENGWMRVGFTGEQLEMSESYINTGSVYLCSVGLLPLGLPATDSCGAAESTPVPNVKAW